MSIRVLSQTLINQIAAGEVIVRMASVVKELVENSIDAGARRVEVSLANDGRDVEVRDDGIGMDRDDAELSLQRHATSKISSVEDLFALHTRGFRGEAIPSIASVSRLEIQTRQRDALSGTRVVVEGGRILRIEALGCPPGTRIVVRDLFYNTPARRKFLKSIVSEMNAVLTTITRQALAQPAIGFRVERDGRELLDVPPGQSLEDRFVSLLGSQVKHPPLPLNIERGNISIAGLLGHPNDARGDRRSQYFFVNERPFVSKAFAASLEQACRGFVMTGRFPIVCVFITVPPNEVDFNVHPTKDEVRFQDERAVAGAVFRAAQRALEGSTALVGRMDLGDEQDDAGGVSIQPPTGTPDRPAPMPAGSPGFFQSPEQLVRRAFDRKRERIAVQGDLLTGGPEHHVPPPPPEPPAPPRVYTALRHSDGSAVSAGPGERPDTSFWQPGLEPEPLGQIAETYIVARYGDDLLLIDQHAAHERLVYLALKRRPRETAEQPLLIPITMELEAAQSETLRGVLPAFEETGIRVEAFGPRTWAIHSLPADLPEFDPVPLVMDLLNDLEESRRGNALEDFRDRLLIRTACHSAIRAGQVLNREAMADLLRQIREERLSLTCPHGRPTIVRLSKGELDRQFKRIV